ncbi:hypothetical protein ABZS77_12610 [Micromonospora sp. NPDC005298]|uniref:hypothetical protein n=1 Tax=Micromonospora sp. NPDC005298 TaxID=3156873 RepID=UPI0033A18C79
MALAVAVALTCAVAGCSHAERRPVAAPTASSPESIVDAPPSEATSPPTDSPQAGSATPTPPTGGGSRTTGGGSRTTGDGSYPPGAAAPDPTPNTDPSCSPGTLLAASRTVLDGSTAGLDIARVDVLTCKNSYARVIAVPAGSGEILPKPQIFLHQSGTRWQLAGRAGAGTDCGDSDLASDIKQACGALGR